MVLSLLYEKNIIVNCIVTSVSQYVSYREKMYRSAPIANICGPRQAPIKP